MTANSSNLFDLLGTTKPRSRQISNSSQPKTHYLKACDEERYLTGDPEYWSSDIKEAQMFSVEAAKAIVRIYRLFGMETEIIAKAG